MDRTDLPIEAVKINGTYIEDVLAGYTTVITSGREGLPADLDTYSVGSADGETIKGSRFPVRRITVEWALHADSMEDLRRKLTRLNNLLSLDEADFVFNDEADKFYAGKPIMGDSFKDYKNAVTGSYEIYCAYPFKRSVYVRSLSSDDVSGVVVDGNTATFTFNYPGTMPARPILRAEFASAKSGGDYNEDGDCGYVAFLDAEENIIQLGNPDVIDVDQYNKNGTLANSEFTSLTGWTASNVTTGNITDTFWNGGQGQTQSYAIPSGTASLTRTTEGTINFEYDIVHRLCVSSVTQVGSFECLAKNGSTTVAGFAIRKTGSGTTGTVEYILNDKVVGTDSIDLSLYNEHFGYCNRTPVYVQETYYEQVVTYVKKKKKKKKKKVKVAVYSWEARTRTVQSGWNYTQSNLNSGFSKDGAVVIFSVGELADRTFKCADIENVPSVDLVFNFTGSFYTNALHSCSFIAKAGVPFAEIPNVFTAGDVVEADCNDANVYLYRDGSTNGHLEPQYGALGNDWEDFLIKPGSNSIRCVWSEWVNSSYKPKVQIAFNEVYL